VQQWQRTALQKLTKFSISNLKLQADSDACRNAASGLASAFGVNSTGNPSSSEACILKVIGIFEWDGANAPTQASIGAWCKGCAVPIKAALAKLLSVCKRRYILNLAEPTGCAVKCKRLQTSTCSFSLSGLFSRPDRRIHRVGFKLFASCVGPAMPARER